MVKLLTTTGSIEDSKLRTILEGQTLKKYNATFHRIKNQAHSNELYSNQALPPGCHHF